MPSKTQSIILGAAVYTIASVIVSFIVVNGGQAGQYLGGVLCCLVALIGPMVAIWHYTNTNSLTIPIGTGAGMGAITVVIGGAIAYVIQLGMQAVGVFPSDEAIMERTRDQLVSQGMDAAQIEQVMGMSEMFSGPAGVAMNLVVALLIGAIGGMIAAAIFKKGTVADDFEV